MIIENMNENGPSITKREVKIRYATSKKYFYPTFIIFNSDEIWNNG